MRLLGRAMGAVCLLLVCGGCSIKQAGLNRMASALSDASVVYESDNDPEFVRVAAPSTLKTVEMLLSQSPRNERLLATACRGFTEYSYAFLHVESELRPSDPAAAELRRRAVLMYERARGYCVRGLQVRHAQVTGEAALAPQLATMTAADVPLLYWTAVSWGAELSIAPNQLVRVGELVTVRAILGRARELDEAWDQGAIYEALIALDGLPVLAGGSPTRAAADFERARTLSANTSAFAYVAYAATVADTARKRRLLEQALAIDVMKTPRRRLTNLVAQRYARAQLAGMPTAAR
jgi:TRAP transporter T-component